MLLTNRHLPLRDFIESSFRSGRRVVASVCELGLERRMARPIFFVCAIHHRAWTEYHAYVRGAAFRALLLSCLNGPCLQRRVAASCNCLCAAGSVRIRSAFCLLLCSCSLCPCLVRQRRSCHHGASDPTFPGSLTLGAARDDAHRGGTFCFEAQEYRRRVPVALQI